LRLTPLVRPDLEPYRDRLKAIGVEDLTEIEILQCLQDEQWLLQQPTVWFVELYAYLQTQQWAIAAKLRKLKLLPLSNGSRVTAEDRSIYLTLATTKELERLKQVILVTNMPIGELHPAIYEALLKNEHLKKWMVETFGLKEPSPSALCQDLAHVLQQQRESISEQDLVRMTGYIVEQYSELDAKTLSEIKATLPVALANGTTIVPTQRTDRTPLVVPSTLDPIRGWQIVFADASDRTHLMVLSDAYIAANALDKTKKQWSDFFQALGAKVSPPPKCAVHQWEWWQTPANLSQAVRDHLQKNTYPKNERWVEDWLPFRWLEKLAGAPQSDIVDEQRTEALLLWLENSGKGNWNFGKAQLKQRNRYKNQSQPNYFDSELLRCLRNAAWFPSTKGTKSPKEVFLDKPELRELFGDSVPYARKNPSLPVATLLGMNQNATIDELLRHLQTLGAQDATKASKRVVEKIYTFLAERWQPHLKQSFDAQPLLLSTKPVPKWCSTHDAMWPNMSAVFRDQYVYLEGQYSRNLKSFFVGKLKISEQPDEEEYMQAYLEWTVEADPAATSRSVERALQRIYPELLRVARRAELPDWWDELDEALVWTENNLFAPASTIFVPDDRDLHDLFSLHGVLFAWRPEKASFAEYRPLYQALKVRPLTANVMVKSNPGKPVPNSRVLLTQAAKQTICIALWNEQHDDYQQIRKNGLLEKFLTIHEQMVESLTVRYILAGTEASDEDSPACWEQNDNILYMSQRVGEDRVEVEVSALLARQLIGSASGRGLADLIGCMLRASPEKANAFQRKHNWTMPASEMQWIDALLQGRASTLTQESQPPTEEAEDDVEDIALVYEDEAIHAEERDTAQNASIGSWSPEQFAEPAFETQANNREVIPQQDSHLTEDTQPPALLDRDRERQASHLKNGNGKTHHSQATDASDDIASQNEGAESDRSRERPRDHFAPSEQHPASHADSGPREPKYHNGEWPGSSTETPQYVAPTRGGGAREAPARPRLRSYIGVSGDVRDEFTGGISPAEIEKIEQAGVQAVRRYECRNDRFPLEHEHFHEGWDISSYDQDYTCCDAQVSRFIEVKSTKYGWDQSGVSLTPAQHRKAVECRDDYYVYVVEYVFDDSRRRIYVLHDPAGKIAEYRFDDSLKRLVSEQAADPEPLA